MDLNEITKVTNRKRLNDDAEKLREKVSREKDKIIKLKVAQDTAYWDLKEKLRQVEGNHERLQQNMVELQMQHEAISGQYQEELRLRPDTLNKMSATREICDVLQEYSERLTATVSRCKVDQANLYEAYRKSGQLVRDLKTKHERTDEKNRQLIDNLQETVKLTSEHQNQMVQYLTAAKQQSDAELSEARVQLATAVTRGEELAAAGKELSRQLEQRNSTLASFQKEAEQMVHQFTAQNSIMKNEIADKDKKIKEVTEECESLKRALADQDEQLASERGKSAQLEERLEEQAAARDQQLEAAASERRQLLDDLQNAKTEIKNIKNDVLTLQDDKERLNTVLNNAEAELLNLKEAFSDLESEKLEISALLTECQVQLEGVRAELAELQDQHQELLKTHEDMMTEAKTFREEQEVKTNEQLEMIAAKDKELDDKAGTIAQLMREVRAATDGTTKAEAALVELRGETEAALVELRGEVEAARRRDDQREQQLAQAQAALADKENELTKQMSVILDMRKEKVRLMENLGDMQKKIDNIQKLSAPEYQQVERFGEAAEQDDNARSFALTPLPPPPGNTNMEKPKVVPQRKLYSDSKQLDSMVFNLFSDSSTDGDNVIDRNEVNRRFEALSRGVGCGPLPLSALKRRAQQPPPAAGDDDEQLSLSQVRASLRNKGNEKSKTFFKTKRTDTKIKKMKGPNN